MSERAVVLLSGGLDSTTLLALMREAGQQIYALSFAYGQRHAVELACARRQAQRFGAVQHEVVELESFGRMVAKATALVAASDLPVPKGGVPDEDPEAREIPSTYVPARNTLFLSYGLAWAEALGAKQIWIGANALDYSGYPDCRPDFLHAWQQMAELATKAGRQGQGVELVAPLVQMHKAQIIARGHALGVDYADTISCYDPVLSPDAARLEAGTEPTGAAAAACGVCESCTLRKQGFVDAGVPDPTRYAA